jgi:putative membrane protein
MIRKYLSFYGVAMLAFLISCNSNDAGTTISTGSTVESDSANTNVYGPNHTNSLPLSSTDSTFVMEAASSSFMEVELGNFAQQKSRNQQVKDFGAMMVSDHQQAGNELKTISGSRNMMAPDTMGKKHRAHVEMLRKVSAANLDKQYMNMMVTAHNEDISKFERAASSASDQQIRVFAEKTLQSLRKHRDSAQAINSRL